jgi:hypothetical protein
VEGSRPHGAVARSGHRGGALGPLRRIGSAQGKPLAGSASALARRGRRSGGEFGILASGLRPGPAVAGLAGRVRGET